MGSPISTQSITAELEAPFQRMESGAYQEKTDVETVPNGDVQKSVHKEIGRNRCLEYATFAESAWYRNVNKHLVSLLPDLPSGSVILDIGCGNGDPTAMLAEKFPESRVIGVEPSESMLQEARNKFEKHDQISVVHGDGRRLHEIAEHADLVTGFNMVHYLGNDDERSELFRSVAKLLPSGGTLALNTGFFKGSKGPNAVFFYASFCDRLCVLGEQRGINVPEVMIKSMKKVNLGAEKYEKLLRASGFGDVTVVLEPQRIPVSSLRAFFRTEEVAKGILGGIPLEQSHALLKAAIDAETDNVSDDYCLEQNWLYLLARKS